MKTTRKLIAQSLLVLITLLAAQFALAQPVEVISADPPEAVQGTVNLDVTIQGSGFDSSATVHFFKTGTVNPAGITVNSSRTRGQKKIIANIDVATDADVDDFDIEVRLSGGRGGKGTTLFRVLQNTGGQETWSFSAISSGHVLGSYVSKEYGISNDVHNIVFNEPSNNAISLGEYFVLRDYDGRSGNICFDTDVMIGTMQVYDEFGSDADLVARVWFRAANDPADPGDSLDDVKYVLDLFDGGQGWNGPFPPAQVAYSSRLATHWELRNPNKGWLRNEPCVSSGIVAFPASEGVLFEVIQNP